MAHPDIQHTQNSSTQRNYWVWFTLFMLWPFGVFVKSLQWFRTKDAMNLFWLLCIYFGITMVINEGYYTDSIKYKLQFEEMHETGMTINELTSSFYSSGSRELDIVQPLIGFIVSKFTGDYRILFGVYGLIFGFFYSRNIWLLINKTNIRISFFAATLLLAFIVVVGIWNINGFRYNTAVQIFIYGTLSYFLEGKKNSLLFAVVAVFVHWSFLIALAVLILYLFIGNRSRIYFALFIISFFITTLQIDIIRQWFFIYAPAIIQESRSGYLSEGYHEAIERSYVGANWLLRGHLEAMKWFIFISYSYIYLFGGTKISMNKQLFKLFNFSLLFYVFVNVFANVPSMARFYAVANMLSVAFLFLYVAYLKENIPVLLKTIATPALAIFILFKIRMGLDFMGSSLILGNPITAMFIKNQQPLIDFIKGLL